jgi:hypothetical protein
MSTFGERDLASVGVEEESFAELTRVEMVSHRVKERALHCRQCDKMGT